MRTTWAAAWATCALAAGCSAGAARAESLVDAIRQALAFQPAVKGAYARMKSAGQRVKVERGPLLPKVDVRADTGYEYLDAPSTRNRTTRAPGSHRYTSLWRNSASLFVNQLVFDGFQTVNLVRSARARERQAGHRFVNTRQTVALQAIAAYLDVARTRRFVALARRNAEVHGGILGGIVQLERQGRATRADILQAQARYYEATARLKSFNGELKRATVRYMAVVGSIPPADLKTPGPEMLRPRYAEMNLSEAYRIAVNRNPEIRAAIAEIRARRHSVDATKGLFVPRVELQLENTIGNNLDGTRGHSTNVTALVLLTWNLYRGGSDVARRREAIANLTVAQYDAADVRRVVRERLGQAYEAFATDRSTLSDNLARVQSNSALVNSYAQQFLAGQRSLLDRLDVQNDLFLAQLELANSRSRMYFNYFSFVAATGGLLTYFGFVPDAPPTEVDTALARGDGIDPTGGPQEEYRALFELILKDPNNPELNLRYARMAIERGELRKAVAAYERILAKHPDNADARQGLARVQRQLKPTYTEAVALFGGQYESNPLRLSGRFKSEQDGVFFGRMLINDERWLGDMRWRTNVDTYANLHINIRSLDYGFISTRTGPVLPVGTEWQVHGFVAGGYAWYDGRTLQGSAGAGLTFEPISPGMLRSITLRGDYRFIGDSFSSRDAYVLEVSGKLTKIGLFSPRGIATFQPYYRYNGVTGQGDPFFGPEGELYPLIFHQIGGRLDYFFELRANLTLNANLTVEYRHYFEEVLFESKNRRDILLAPGTELIVSGLLKGRADLILSYRFEYNSSNDGNLRYTNHIAGVRMLWRLR